MANVPYLASPGSIKTALERIKTAATPDRVTQDFVTTKLSIKGGAGRAIPPYLKKIGFVNSDGSPTELYKKFRNPTLGPYALGDAIKIGYKELSAANEYFYDLTDKDLTALVVQVTGLAPNNSVARQTMGTLKAIKSLAKFDKVPEKQRDEEEREGESEEKPEGKKGKLRGNVRSEGVSLSYTINLNLPATADQAVFNAIFKSLREHILSGNEE